MKTLKLLAKQDVNMDNISNISPQGKPIGGVTHTWMSFNIPIIIR